jgi:uncharacterized protein (DUF2225 family)
MKSFFEIFSKNMRSVVAFLTVIEVFVILMLLFFKAAPEKNDELLYLALGLALGNRKDVSNYFFGSSKDKSDQEKAAIAQTSSASVETTISKEKDKPKDVISEPTNTEGE